MLDIGLDLSSPTGEFVSTVMAAVAQLERRMIGQRTRDGLAAAKARVCSSAGHGRCRTMSPSGSPASEPSGATLAAIADRFNDEGAPTARGGSRWHPATVRAVLNRAA